MARVVALLLLPLCACVGRAYESRYVPGGEGLPDRARLAYRRALDQTQRGDARQAFATLSDLCSRHPTRLGFHLLRLRVARELLGPEEAGRLYEPPPPGVAATRAEILARLARIDENERADLAEVLLFAVEREPKEPFWHLALADVELRGYDPALDRANEDRARGRVRESEDIMRDARVLLDRARDHAEKALELDPLFAEAHLVVGYVCARYADVAESPEEQDRWRELAGERYAHALELDPESLPALLDRAENHLYFDRYSEAIDDLKAASEIAPKEVLVWSNLGSIYYDTGQLSKAVRAYEKALDLDPSAARTRTAYADCLRRKNDLELAVDELERARRDADESDHALLAEIAFKLGTIHEYERRYRQAVEEYQLHIRHVGEGNLSSTSAAKARSRIRYIVDHAFE